MRELGFADAKEEDVGAQGLVALLIAKKGA
jgi:hypothetical protein